MKKQFLRFNNPLNILFGILILAGLYLASLYNYLLFHILAETFSIVVACGMFMIAWNARRFMKSNYLLFLGIGYLFVGAVDALHTFAYKGMNIFPGYDANLPTQLWIAARYLQSLSLLIAPLFLSRKLKVNAIFACYSAIFSLILITTFSGIFPDCFVESSGLTLFKILSEYFISGILVVSIFMLYKKRREFDAKVLKLVIASIIVTIGSEFAFTSYVSVYGIFNLIGHMLKTISLYLMYTAIIKTGLETPYSLLFRNLKRHEEALQKTNEQLQEEVSEHKLTEEALKAEKEFTEMTLNALTDTFFVFEPATRKALRWNKAFKEVSGYSDEEIRSLKAPDSYYSEEDLKKAAVSTQKILSEGKGIVELSLLTKDGRVIPTEYTASTLKDNEGNLRYIIAVGRDITERKRAEEELQKAKEDAEAANRAKSKFLANMSHEFRTPLNGVLGYAQILKRNPDLTEKQHEYLDIIQRSGDHLLTLINDILDISKIEAGKLMLESTAFNLSESLRVIVDMIRLRAYQKGLSFIYKEDAALPYTVQGDEKCLRQILLNLLGNAVKFTEQGGVTLRVESLHPPTPLKGGLPPHSGDQKSPLEGGRGVLRFLVEDTGIGIPPEQIEAIFSPFEQVKDRRLYTEGTGLGLAISQRLVRMMDSELHVCNTVGQGSIFWFDLDLPETEGVVAPILGPSTLLRIDSAEGSKILIVDDLDENRIVLKDMLLPLGFEIVEAADGQEAIDKAAASHPDLILMDLVMPGVDGFEATRQIRQIPALNDVIIIAVSANVFEQTREESLAAGCHDFIPKPIGEHILFDKLQAYLKLKWIYDDNISDFGFGISDLRSSQFAIRNPQSKIYSGAHPGEPIFPPPQEELARLDDLAMIGDIMGIREVIWEIEALDPKFKPFAAKTRELAKALKVSEIQRFVKQYLDE